MIPSPTRKPHPHRYRSVRDANARELGYCCLVCGGLLVGRGIGDDEIPLLEACSLYLLKAEEAGRVRLDRDARRTLQARRRKLRREARG